MDRRTVKEEYEGLYLSSLMENRTRDVIANHVEKEQDKPLFLYIPSLTVHYDNDGYYAPEQFYSCDDSVRCDMQAMLTATEHMVRQIIGFLDDAGMWDNTLLIFASDNGAPNKAEQSNGHLRGYKYELWEGGVRTVAFMYSPSPSVLPHRGVTDCLVHVSDWYLTLVAVSGGWGAWIESGGVIPSALDSRDQSQYLIKGQGMCSRWEMLVHINPVRRIAAYIEGQYKLLVGRDQDDVDGQSECEENASYPLDENGLDLSTKFLYNIYTDPSETEELATHRPDLVEYLLKRLLAYLPEQKLLHCVGGEVEGSFPSPQVPWYLPFWDNGTVGLHGPW